MRLATQLAVFGLASFSSAAYMASTTRYAPNAVTACGCASKDGLGNGVYIAAGNQALFDTAGAGWCGAGCGKCYKLTSTGSSPCQTCGTGYAKGQEIIVMLADLCGAADNAKWCPAVGGKNEYGYSYHFDIMASTDVFGDNTVVEFEPIACPSEATNFFGTSQCNGKLASDETPVGLSSGAASAPAVSSSTPIGSASAPLAESSTHAPPAYTSAAHTSAESSAYHPEQASAYSPPGASTYSPVAKAPEPTSPTTLQTFTVTKQGTRSWGGASWRTQKPPSTVLNLALAQRWG